MMKQVFNEQYKDQFLEAGLLEGPAVTSRT